MSNRQACPACPYGLDRIGIPKKRWGLLLTPTRSNPLLTLPELNAKRHAVCRLCDILCSIA